MKSLYFFGLLFGIGVFLAWRKTEDQPTESFKRAATVFCAPSFDPAKMNEGNAPLFKNYATVNFTVSTKNKKAQQYFNQGLTLLYAFNHGEAGRSFKAAIKNDSTLAMAYWGLGMVLGPNYNAALNPTSLEEINDVMEMAVKLSANTSSKEKGLIQALAKRFPKEEVKDMAPFNEAYAAAMKELYEAFPDEQEIAAIYADALMNEHPWNFWSKDGTPQPWTANVVKVLEDNIKKFPKNAGLNHSYIHAIEASQHPEKAMASAKLLETLIPTAGHLVHMPSHIYIRTGLYHQGVLVNEKATLSDSAYVAQCKAEGTYPMMYYPHNIHFLAACAFFEGNSKKAIDAAWMVSRKADRRFLLENVSVQHFSIIPYYVMVQLGKWEEIMKLPEPGSSLKYPSAIWHYARGMAYTSSRKLKEARSELAAIREIASDESLKKLLIWDMNSAMDLVMIAQHTLEGEIAMREQHFDESVIAFNKAVTIEDNLVYQEPPDWFFSVRLSLGNALLEAKRFTEAQKVYEDDLKNYKENGWALMGLYQSLKGQQKELEASEVKKRFDKAWAYADIQISTSRKY